MTKPMSLLKNERGITMVEVLVASALLALAAIFVATGLDSVTQFATRVDKVKDRDRAVSSIVANLVENVQWAQVSFDPSWDFADAALAPAKLPLAWKDQKLLPVAECDDCPGRIGFVLQPGENRPGLFKLTIRVTHPSFNEKYRDFVFWVASK